VERLRDDVLSGVIDDSENLIGADGANGEPVRIEGKFKKVVDVFIVEGRPETDGRIVAETPFWVDISAEKGGHLR
jgi:hypothetical protein